jgi:hypothetical protein
MSRFSTAPRWSLREQSSGPSHRRVFHAFAIHEKVVMVVSPSPGRCRPRSPSSNPSSADRVESPDSDHWGDPCWRQKEFPRFLGLRAPCGRVIMLQLLYPAFAASPTEHASPQWLFPEREARSHRSNPKCFAAGQSPESERTVCWEH